MPLSVRDGLNAIGVFVGFYLGGWYGAYLGYMAAQQVGSLLGLYDQSNRQLGQRITDFKGLYSKYGMSIPHGYGGVRLPGNMIWSGPVIEVENIETTCVGAPGILGFASPKSCNTVVSYEYFQSAAIAFAEGPACAIPRIWADGQVVSDTRPETVNAVASVVQRNRLSSPCRPETYSPFKKYFGTPTQEIDPQVKFWEGPENTESGLDEAIAFRNIVYIMVVDLDLAAYGYRMPAFSAEVAFGDCSKSLYTRMDQSEVLVENNGGLRMTYDAHGLVSGRPELGWVRSLLMRGIYNLRTGGLVFESTPGKAYSWNILTEVTAGTSDVGPNFEVMDAYFPFGNRFFTSVSNFITGRQGKIVYFDLPLAFAGRIEYSFYDELRAGFWCVFLLRGFMVFYPAKFPEQESSVGFETREEIRLNEDTGLAELVEVTFGAVEGTKDEVAGFANSPGVTGAYVDPMQLSTSENGSSAYFNLLFSHTESLADRSPFCFPDKECNVWWFSNASTGFNTYLSMVGGPFLGVQLSGQVQDSLGSPVLSAAGIFYCPTTDAIFFVTNGYLYKKLRLTVMEELADITEFPRRVLLPPITDTENVIPWVAVDLTSIKSSGVHAGILYSSESGGIGVVRFLDLSSMTAVDSRPDGQGFEVFEDSTGHPGLRADTHYIPHLDMSWQGTNYTSNWFRGASKPILLSDLVTDIMTRNDGDARARLTPDDIDVSELTDLVKGFAVIAQDTIRSYMITLQQTYKFDAVESDGKIKFLKRGRAITENLVENDLAAHNYDSSSEARLQPLVHERQGDIDLPNEVVVSYTDYQNELLQGTQRARRQAKEVDNNVEVTLPVVLDADEAAKVADVLLSETWMTRAAPFSFKVGPQHMQLDPTDVIRVTMNDSSTYKLRITSALLGADGVNDIIAAEEFTSIYESTAVGVSNLVEPLPVPVDDTEPLVYDITGRFLQQPETNNAAGVVVGIGAYDAICAGGTLWAIPFSDDPVTSTSQLGGGNEIQYEPEFLHAAGVEGCVCWGTVVGETGQLNEFIATNVREDETELQIEIFGGVVPATQTDAQALAGEGFLILGREIIAYTSVVDNFASGLIGNDIASDGGIFGGTLTSTTTDFTTLLSAGDTFTLRRENSAPPYRAYAYLVENVSANSLDVRSYFQGPPYQGQTLQGNAWVAGEQVLIGQNISTVTLTGLYRGLYGTQHELYHPQGEYAAFSQNMSFGFLNNPPPTGFPLTTFSVPGRNLQKRRHLKTTVYQSANLKPWAPTDVIATGGTLSWTRQDKVYSDGIIPGAPTGISETVEKYEVIILDGQTYGDESFILSRQTTGTTSISFSTDRPRPVLIFQLSGDENVGRGFPYRGIINSSGLYRFEGTHDDPQIPRWGQSTLECIRLSDQKLVVIQGGLFSLYDNYPCIKRGDLSAPLLWGSPYCGHDLIEAGSARDVETVGVLLPGQVNGAGAQYGIYARAQGGLGDGTTMLCAALGGSANKFVISQFTSGAEAVLAEIPFIWEEGYWSIGLWVGTQSYGFRLRVFGNRIQAKVWATTGFNNLLDPRPSEPAGGWMLDTLFNDAGPYYGGCGLFGKENSAFMGFQGVQHNGDPFI